MKTETELSKHLEDKWKSYFPKFKLIQFQLPILGCISGDKIGYADFAFTSFKESFIVEIKFDNMGKHDFWSSLKVLGYCKSMNLSLLKHKTKVGFYNPVIMIKKEFITYDVLPILYHLKCGYISFDIKDNFIDLDINLHHSSEGFI